MLAFSEGNDSERKYRQDAERRNQAEQPNF
jgi:hypothetical protein